MIELDEATRRALLAREGPPATARADILAGLRTRLGPGDPGDSGDSLGELGGGAGAGGQIGWAAKIVGATLGLTTAGLLTVKLGAAVLGSVAAEPEPAPVVVEPPEPAQQAVPASPIAIEPAPSEPLVPEPELEPGVDAGPAQPALAQPQPGASTLAAELELVAAAKQLRATNPEAALAKLELHAERFADGSLAPERDCLRVELLCALDNRDALAKARSRFLQQHGDSPLRARVLASCDNSGTDSAVAGD